MIGIVGYGFVGRAVEHGFSRTEHYIVDPKHFPQNTLGDLVEHKPKAIFVCVPTDDGDNFSILKKTLDLITNLDYNGLIVVKSTALPKYLEGYNIIYNPEFLSRGTAFDDFVYPPFLLFGGKTEECYQLLDIYESYSTVDTSKVFMVNVKTASLVKYIFNSFYATKVTFMNQMFDVCQQEGVDWNDITNIMFLNPWIANQHVSVPGHEGRGFAGPCLPKDTKALAEQYDVPLLYKVIELNDKYRK